MLFLYLIHTLVGVVKRRFWAFAWGPAGFWELREAGRNRGDDFWPKALGGFVFNVYGTSICQLNTGMGFLYRPLKNMIRGLI